jgi:FtsZ-interacting cell division protein ZipA
LSHGAIAGIAVAGTIALIAIVAIVVALFTRRDKRQPLFEKQTFARPRANSTTTGVSSNVDNPAAPFLGG